MHGGAEVPRALAWLLGLMAFLCQWDGWPHGYLQPSFLPPQVYVLKRPYVDEFLRRMGELFECVLFTASLAKVPDSRVGGKSR